MLITFLTLQMHNLHYINYIIRHSLIIIKFHNQKKCFQDVVTIIIVSLATIFNANAAIASNEIMLVLI